jgi:hypothetical protein
MLTVAKSPDKALNMKNSEGQWAMPVNCCMMKTFKSSILLVCENKNSIIVCHKGNFCVATLDISRIGWITIFVSDRNNLREEIISKAIIFHRKEHKGAENLLRSLYILII